MIHPSNPSCGFDRLNRASKLGFPNVSIVDSILLSIDVDGEFVVACVFLLALVRWSSTAGAWSIESGLDWGFPNSRVLIQSIVTVDFVLSL